MVRVKIYSTTTCPYCKMERDYLDSKGIKYENDYVDNDPAGASEMLEKSGQMGVPFTIIQKEDGTEEKILGFDKGRLNEALGIS
ncbi:MAG TPA: glutaredoxin domain-containing protein [Candidatus Nanoarchaeia archaeon]